METILDIIGKLLGAAAVGVIAYLAPKVRAWITERIGEKKTEKLYKTVETMAYAAEQLYKENDDDGAIRKAYVVEQLNKLQIAVSGEVNAMIEAAVWNINKETEK